MNGKAKRAYKSPFLFLRLFFCLKKIIGEMINAKGGVVVSKTSTALIIKFIMTFVMAAIVFELLNMGNATWFWVFVVSLIGTALNYLLGDLYVLPKFGNIAASIGDGILAALVAFVIDALTRFFDTTFASLVLFALLIAVGEYFFHQYLKASPKVEP